MYAGECGELAEMEGKKWKEDEETTVMSLLENNWASNRFIFGLDRKTQKKSMSSGLEGKVR